MNVSKHAASVSISIRSAVERDISQLGRLLLQVNEVHHQGRPDLFRSNARKYTDQELGTLLSNPDTPILVAVNERGLLQGYAMCAVQRHDGDSNMMPFTTFYIDDLCVDEKHRRQGIGRQLFEAAVLRAKELGCHNVTLNVWSCNPAAAAFYRAQGLKPQKVCLEYLLETE